MIYEIVLVSKNVLTPYVMVRRTASLLRLPQQWEGLNSLNGIFNSNPIGLQSTFLVMIYFYKTDSENRTCNYKCGVYAIQKMDPFQNTSGYNNVIDYRELKVLLSKLK